MFPFASIPHVLRSFNKDESYQRYMNTQLQELSTKFLGARFTSDKEEYIRQAADMLYLFSTITSQTLGEEYTDLLPVHAPTSSATIFKLTTLRRLVYILLAVLIPQALKRGIQRYFPQCNANEVVEHLRRLNVGIFFLAAGYYTLALRFSSIRYLFVGRGGRSSVEDHNAPFFSLGLLIMVEFLVRGYFLLQYFLTLSNSGLALQASPSPHRLQIGGTEGSDTEDASNEATAGKCMLCLGGRKLPTATSCGHMFCWRCVSEWCNANRPSLCPLCRQSISLNTLVPLVAYQSPTSGQNSS